MKFWPVTWANLFRNNRGWRPQWRCLGAPSSLWLRPSGLRCLRGPVNIDSTIVGRSSWMGVLFFDVPAQNISFVSPVMEHCPRSKEICNALTGRLWCVYSIQSPSKEFVAGQGGVTQLSVRSFISLFQMLDVLPCSTGHVVARMCMGAHPALHNLVKPPRIFDAFWVPKPNWGQECCLFALGDIMSSFPLELAPTKYCNAICLVGRGPLSFVWLWEHFAFREFCRNRF